MLKKNYVVVVLSITLATYLLSKFLGLSAATQLETAGLSATLAVGFFMLRFISEDYLRAINSKERRLLRNLERAGHSLPDKSFNLVFKSEDMEVSLFYLFDTSDTDVERCMIGNYRRIILLVTTSGGTADLSCTDGPWWDLALKETASMAASYQDQIKPSAADTIALPTAH